MGGTYDHSLAGRPRPASRPDLDGGARLRRTHLENPRSVSRSGGVPTIVGRILRELIELAERDTDAELVDALHDALDVAMPAVVERK